MRDLASRFHTRRETIYRDLRALTDAGYPIIGDENGRLSHPRLLDRDSRRLARIELTEDEITALLWAAGNHGSGEPFGKALRSASSKLRASAAAKKHLLASELDQAIGGRRRGNKDYSGQEPIILRLVEAIIRRQVCDVTYQTLGGKPKTYSYHPYRLLNAHGGLYCLGRVPTHYDVTTLAIERIRELHVRDHIFTADANFDPVRYSNEAFGVVWEKPMTVVLRFRPDQGPYVAEREWHPTQSLQTLPDGYVELTFRAGGFYEIVRWILRWGDAVEVIQPAQLRKEVADKLRSAARIYGTQAL